MYKSKHFAPHEVVPKHVYDARGDKSYQCIDERLLKLTDRLRDLFECSLTINNYNWGGNRQWSGLRTSDSPYYSPASQHTFGRALDIIVKDYTADEARSMVKQWFAEGKFSDIVDSITLEEGVGWLHIDIRNNAKGVNTFTP